MFDFVELKSLEEYTVFACYIKYIKQGWDACFHEKADKNSSKRDIIMYLA